MQDRPVYKISLWVHSVHVITLETAKDVERRLKTAKELTDTFLHKR